MRNALLALHAARQGVRSVHEWLLSGPALRVFVLGGLRLFHVCFFGLWLLHRLCCGYLRVIGGRFLWRLLGGRRVGRRFRLFPGFVRVGGGGSTGLGVGVGVAVGVGGGAVGVAVGGQP